MGKPDHSSVRGQPRTGFGLAIEPLGTAFVNLLKMVVIPLVAAVIFVGIGALGDLKKLGQLGAITLVLSAGVTGIAVLLGMGVMQLVLPLASVEGMLVAAAVVDRLVGGEGDSDGASNGTQTGVQ